MARVDNWTPEQRAELVALVQEQAAAQIEGDADMRATVDWMVEAAGLTPSPEIYRLVLLVSAVLLATGSL